MRKFRCLQPLGGNAESGMAAVALFLLLFLLMYIGIEFNGERHRRNLAASKRIAVARNLELLQRNVNASFDCAKTKADAMNLANCTQWSSYTADTGEPSGASPFVKIYAYGKQYAAGMTRHDTPISLASGRVQARARCDATRRIILEVKVLNPAGKVAALNDGFRSRDGWINVFDRVGDDSNPFARCTL